MARLWYDVDVEVTPYFERRVLNNPTRIRDGITKELCEWVVANYTEREQQPEDNRWRYWARPEGRRRYLRVIVTEDGTGLLNAFFDEGYTIRKIRKVRG